MKIQATFFDIQGNVYESGEYKTMKGMRNARERYELQYGACLRSEVKEVQEISAFGKHLLDLNKDLMEVYKAGMNA